LDVTGKVRLMLEYLSHISLKVVVTVLVVLYAAPGFFMSHSLGTARRDGPPGVLISITQIKQQGGQVVSETSTRVHPHSPDGVRLHKLMTIAIAYFVGLAPLLAGAAVARLAVEVPLLHALTLGLLGCGLSHLLVPYISSVMWWWPAVSLALALVAAFAARRRTDRK
jgi:hypothetical protein